MAGVHITVHACTYHITAHNFFHLPRRYSVIPSVTWATSGNLNYVDDFVNQQWHFLRSETSERIALCLIDPDFSEGKLFIHVAEFQIPDKLA